jgi:hypothetical protein
VTITAQAPKGGIQRRKSGQQPKPLQFRRMPHPLMRQDCIVVVSHAANATGYVAIHRRDGSGGSKVGAHRLAFLSKHGTASLPHGWEVDHICGNRACVNRSHLQPLRRSDHKRITNRDRSAAREEAGRCTWEAHGQPGGNALARLAGIPQTTAARWVRKWKADPDG